MLQPVTNAYSIPNSQRPVAEKKSGSTGDFNAALNAAHHLTSGLQAMPLFKYSHNGVITGDDMRRERDELLADVKARLKRILTAAGLTPPRKVEIAPNGMIVIENDNPNKAEIESLIQNDGMLDQELRKVLSLSTLIKNFEEAIPFQKAYEKDPKAAVQQYSYLFDDRWTQVSSLIFNSEEFYRVETTRTLKSSLASMLDVY